MKDCGVVRFSVCVSVYSSEKRSSMSFQSFEILLVSFLLQLDP